MNVHLQDAAQLLKEQFGERLETGKEEGRDLMAEALQEKMGLSQEKAKEVVAVLEGRVPSAGNNRQKRVHSPKPPCPLPTRQGDRHRPDRLQRPLFPWLTAIGSSNECTANLLVRSSKQSLPEPGGSGYVVYANE